MRPYIFRPAAADDIRRAYAWYGQAREGLGEEFLAEIHVAMQRVLSAPLTYPVLHRQTRRVLVRRFPYGLFFRLIDDTVVFVACFHLHRSPELWKRRR